MIAKRKVAYPQIKEFYPDALMSRGQHLARSGAAIRRKEITITLFDAATALLAQPHLLGQFRAKRRIIWGGHGIVGAQSPFFAVLLGCHVVLGAEVTLERFEFLSVLQTNDVLR